MPADPPRKSIRKVILDLFPWLARVRVSALDGGLSVRSAAQWLHLGGDAGDPRALTAADTAGKWAFDPGIPGSLAPAIYVLNPGGEAYLPMIMLTPGSTVGGTLPSIPAATPGMPVALGPGSSRVTVAQ